MITQHRAVVSLEPADTQADHRQAIFIHIEPAEGLAEDFGAGVDGDGAHRHFRGDKGVAGVVADSLRGAGEDDFLDARFARGLEGAMEREQVQRQQLAFEIVLIGAGGEVDEGGDALAGAWRTASPS